MRRSRPATVALLVALSAVLALAPLARAQTTSVLPSTTAPGAGAGASTTAPAPSTTVPAPSTVAPASDTAAPTTAPPPSTATIQTTAVPQTAAPASTATPASTGGGSGHDDKLPVLLLAIVGAILLAAALAIAAARWWAYDPPWLVRARHSTAEAGWRTSAAWAEFRDWVRLGR